MIGLSAAFERRYQNQIHEIAVRRMGQGKLDLVLVLRFARYSIDSWAELMLNTADWKQNARRHQSAS